MRSFKNESFNSENEGALSGFETLKLPDIYDRSFWDSLPLDYREERLKLAEEAAEKDWPPILMSDYLRFSHDGNRTYFEDKYFTRRRMLTSLVMGECIEAKGRFLQKIIDGLYLILGETTWCLPAHNSYIRDTKQFTIPDTSRPVVDLFSGETAAILSVAEALLRPVLLTESSFISTAIDNALYERVMAPYLRFHFWWMGNGLEPMCNWTPWITQNVLLTAFTRPVPEEKNDDSPENTEAAFSNSIMSSPEIAAKLCDASGRVEPPDWKSKHLLPSCKELHEIYDSAVKSVHHFLSEYEEDGCCDEGAQYYSHAGLCLFGCLSILKSISESADLTGAADSKSALKDGSSEKSAAFMSNLSHGSDANASSGHLNSFRQEFSSEMEKIRNIATYIMKVHVGGEFYINFADCSPRAGRRGAREYLFGAFVHDSAMMNFASEDYRSLSWTERLNPSEENLWYHLLNAQCHEKMMNQASVSFCDEHKPMTPDAWFPSTGLMVARDSHYVLAAKAGDNADSHNHNDVGSFILYKDNRPFIIDLGVGSYTQKTFSKDRYDIWTMQSQYHNVPSFIDSDGNIIMEHDGEEYRATDVEYHSGKITVTAGNRTLQSKKQSEIKPELHEATDTLLSPPNALDTSSSEVSLSMSIHEAFPKLDGEFRRKVSLRKKASTCPEGEYYGVTVSDIYTGSYKFAENIITYDKPVAVKVKDISTFNNSKYCYRITVGDIGSILVRGADDVRVEELPITDERLGETWKHSCYRIVLSAIKDRMSLSFI